jgi:integrase
MSINGNERVTMAAKSGALRVIEGGHPINESGKVARPPRRVKNSESRPREYLTSDEVVQLIEAARKRGRWGYRDGTLILIAYRHGLRVSELTALRWSQVDFTNQHLAVVRRKNGKPSTHPLQGDEVRALRKLHGDAKGSQFVFNSERGTPLTTRSVRYLIAEAGKAAQLPFAVHPHMLRHGTGFKLANDGLDTRLIQDYLGHRSVQHTVRYTELAPGRFKDIDWGTW